MAPLFNAASGKKSRKQPKDFFDREKIKEARRRTAESQGETPEDTKQRRREQMAALKAAMPDSNRRPRHHRNQ